MAKKVESAKKQTAVQEVAPPIDKGLFTPDDTAGYYEGMDQGAYAKPFLAILQALSPVVQRGKPEYIEGATPGRIFNTVTKEMFDTIRLTVLARSHTLTYWIPREQGGGILREEPAHVDNMSRFAVIPLDDKNRRIIKEQIDKKTIDVEVIECRNFICYMFAPEAAPGDGQMVILSMSKSQLSVAREWNALIDVKSYRVRDANNAVIRGLPPVLQSGVWELGTVMKTKGENSWYKWTVKFVALHNVPDVVAVVKEKMLIAKQQTVIDRQLEHIADPQETVAGEM